MGKLPRLAEARLQGAAELAGHLLASRAAQGGLLEQVCSRCSAFGVTCVRRSVSSLTSQVSAQGGVVE